MVVLLQLGRIASLGDGTGSLFPVNFKFHRSRRLTRSAIGGEVLAFIDLFNAASTVVNKVTVLSGRSFTTTVKEL